MITSTRDARRPSNPSARLRALVEVLLTALVLFWAAVSNAADLQPVATGLQFPEGTVFVGNTLYFVDYSASSVFRLEGKKVERVWHQDGCGANGLVPTEGGLLVTCYDNGTVIHVSLEGRTGEITRKRSLPSTTGGW